MEQKHRISILATDGQLYALDEYKRATSQSVTLSLIGIVLQTESMGLVIAPNEIKKEWGKTNDYCTGIGEDNVYKAFMLHSGYEDTKAIYNRQKINEISGVSVGSHTAAGYCWEHDFGGTPTRWHLPSLAEFALIATYDEELDKVIEHLSYGFDIFVPDENYWTSCEEGKDTAWAMTLEGRVHGETKNIECRVRPVAKYEPLKPQDATAEEISDEELVRMLRDRGYVGKVTKEYTLKSRRK